MLSSFPRLCNTPLRVPSVSIIQIIKSISRSSGSGSYLPCVRTGHLSRGTADGTPLPARSAQQVESPSPPSATGPDSSAPHPCSQPLRPSVQKWSCRSHCDIVFLDHFPAHERKEDISLGSMIQRPRLRRRHCVGWSVVTCLFRVVGSVLLQKRSSRALYFTSVGS